jgi:hypothetical protein
MKQTSFKQNLTWLRICITLFIMAIVSLFLFSFTVSRRLTGDIWKQFGLSEMQGTEKIKNSFLNNYADYYSLRNAKNIAAGDRAAVATDLLEYTKKYLISGMFKTEYEKLRAQAKPVEPVFTIHTKEDIRKDKIEETRKSIKETEETMKSANADLKKIIEGVLEMHKANLKEYQDPNSAMIDLFFQGDEYERQSNQKRYKEDMANWEKNYPADYKQMIRTRLERYLSLASTVDFNAELVDRAGKKKFVNPAYEAKNYEWKMIYRAGKEVGGVTIAFAKQWLKEL